MTSKRRTEISVIAELLRSRDIPVRHLDCHAIEPTPAELHGTLGVGTVSGHGYRFTESSV